MKFRPINNYVLVEPVQEEVIPGYIIPDAAKQSQQLGKVLAVSKSHEKYPAVFAPMQVEEEDILLYRKNAGVEYHGLRFINQITDVVAIGEDDE